MWGIMEAYLSNRILRKRLYEIRKGRYSEVKLIKCSICGRSYSPEIVRVCKCGRTL